MEHKILPIQRPIEAAVPRVMVAGSLGRAGELLSEFKQTQEKYPLQRLFLWYGLFSGITIAILTWSAVAGFSVLAIFLAVSIVWNRDELPILPYCVAYQWLFIVAGYFYQLVAGYY